MIFWEVDGRPTIESDCQVRHRNLLSNLDASEGRPHAADKGIGDTCHMYVKTLRVFMGTQLRNACRYSQ